MLRKADFRAHVVPYIQYAWSERDKGDRYPRLTEILIMAERLIKLKADSNVDFFDICAQILIHRV